MPDKVWDRGRAFLNDYFTYTFSLEAKEEGLP